MKKSYKKKRSIRKRSLFFPGKDHHHSREMMLFNFSKFTSKFDRSDYLIGTRRTARFSSFYLFGGTCMYLCECDLKISKWSRGW